MEKKKTKQSPPLYYIEQPTFSEVLGNSQTVSVRKRIGGKKTEEKVENKEQKAKPKERNRNVSGKRSQREKKAGSIKNKEKNKKSEEGKERGGEENIKKEIASPKEEVKDLIEYLATRPHFLEPIVACETKDMLIQGKIMDAKDGEITILDGVSLSEEVVKDYEIDNLYIVSL